MKSAVFEGKVLEDIIQAATNYFHYDKDMFIIDVLEEKKGILGFGAFIKANVTLNIDPKLEGQKYLTGLLEHFNLMSDIQITDISGNLTYNLDTENNGLLIGKDGKTLRSIQQLVSTIVNQYSDDHINVLVDIGLYKQKQTKRLETLAKKLAKETLLTKVDVKLDPMNSFERRIIHNVLSDWDHIQTISVGTNPNRCIMIKYVR